PRRPTAAGSTHGGQRSRSAPDPDAAPCHSPPRRTSTRTHAPDQRRRSPPPARRGTPRAHRATSTPEHRTPADRPPPATTARTTHPVAATPTRCPHRWRQPQAAYGRQEGAQRRRSTHVTDPTTHPLRSP